MEEEERGWEEEVDVDAGYFTLVTSGIDVAHNLSISTFDNHVVSRIT